ncbi:unnamed protein product [Nippostrongylus brasiliensis]|uniref:T-box domain-containing protein n=1 Tax=Nippostrongylus brasiliensis TaxID=27835 RepID=A0A0N4YER7_NIPBR|nr:unnamed protein product [Nippostrongylus brasiliensis]
MFPKLEYKIDGLDANLAYGLVLQIEQVDDSRYKFSGGEWSAAGRGETGTISKNVMHHDGVMPGAHWMRQAVNFERVKITNNFGDANPSHGKNFRIKRPSWDQVLRDSPLCALITSVMCQLRALMKFLAYLVTDDRYAVTVA